MRHAAATEHGDVLRIPPHGLETFVPMVGPPSVLWDCG